MHLVHTRVSVARAWGTTREKHTDVASQPKCHVAASARAHGTQCTRPAPPVRWLSMLRCRRVIAVVFPLARSNLLCVRLFSYHLHFQCKRALSPSASSIKQRRGRTQTCAMFSHPMRPLVSDTNLDIMPTLARGRPLRVPSGRHSSVRRQSDSALCPLRAHLRLDRQRNAPSWSGSARTHALRCLVSDARMPVGWQSMPCHASFWRRTWRSRSAHFRATSAHTRRSRCPPLHAPR